MTAKPLGLATLFALALTASAHADPARPSIEIAEQVQDLRTTRAYFGSDVGIAGSEAQALAASLQRARRNGVTGSGPRYRTLSLDQALVAQEWRQSVSRRLATHFDVGVGEDPAGAERQRPTGFAF
ncbi:MAG: hypothetical protein MI920_05850 [Kiloniellales bacterium]|nr:hypothetical protein [Kiloniellales bacterium]